MKTVSISALEQDEDARCEYLLTVGLGFTADQLVFVDESACNRITTRRRCAWAPIGHCARRHDYFVRGKRYISFGPGLAPDSLLCFRYLPAMSLDGILHLAIQDRPYTTTQFNSFIEALLDNMNHFPQPNSVIVMDNASIHKSQELRQMVEERSVFPCYLWHSSDVLPAGCVCYTCHPIHLTSILLRKHFPVSRHGSATIGMKF